MTAPVCRDADGVEIGVGDWVECVVGDHDAWGTRANPGDRIGPVTNADSSHFATKENGVGAWFGRHFRLVPRLPPAEPPATEGVGSELQDAVADMQREMERQRWHLDPLTNARWERLKAAALRALARSKADGGGT